MAGSSGKEDLIDVLYIVENGYSLYMFSRNACNRVEMSVLLYP